MHMQGSSKTHPGCSFASENSSNPRMGSNMPLDSSTLAFKSHLNAHELPFCGPNSLKSHFSLGKLMYRCAFLMLRVLKMGSNILYFSVQIPLECTCTAVILPKFPDASLFRRRTDASLCILSLNLVYMVSLNLVCRSFFRVR